MSISTRKVFLPTVISLALLLALALPAAAQNRAIKGKVTDEKGQPIVDAQITIQGMDMSRTLNAKTNKKGEWIYILGLQFGGSYRVIVHKAGYQPQFKPNVNPQSGEEMCGRFYTRRGTGPKTSVRDDGSGTERIREAKGTTDKEKTVFRRGQRFL